MNPFHEAARLLRIEIQNAAVEIEVRDDLIKLEYGKRIERGTFESKGWWWTATIGFNKFTAEDPGEALEMLTDAYKTGKLGNLPPAWKMRRR
jgi:hypothetical protein